MISKKSVSLVSLALAGVGWLLAVVSSATGGWLACDHDVIEDFNKQACSRIVGHKVNEGIKLNLTATFPGVPFGNTSNQSVDDMVATLKKLGKVKANLKIQNLIQATANKMGQNWTKLGEVGQAGVKKEIAKEVADAANAQQKELGAKLQMAKQIGKQLTKKCQDDLSFVKKAFADKCFDLDGGKIYYYIGIFEDITCEDENNNSLPDCTEKSYFTDPAASAMIYGLLSASVGAAVLVWIMQDIHAQIWQVVLSAGLTIAAGICYMSAALTFAIRYRSWVKYSKELLEEKARGVKYDPETVFGYSFTLAFVSGFVEILSGVVCCLILRMKTNVGGIGASVEEKSGK